MTSLPTKPTVSVVNNCDGTSNLTATNYTGSLLWNTGQTTSSITVTSSGTYFATQTVNGCASFGDTVTVIPKTTPPAPIVNVSNNCNGSSILTATSYTGTLLWNTGATTASITVTSAGTYTVTQTVNGCTSLPGSGTASPNSVTTPSVNVVDYCNGTSILTASNYTGSLLWSTGASTNSITVTSAGLYTVTQTVNSCVSSAGSGTAAPKTTPTAPTVSVVDGIGSSVLTASAYTGNLLWSTSETTASITVTTVGTYTVTQTVNGCTSLAGSGYAAPQVIGGSPAAQVMISNDTLLDSKNYQFDVYVRAKTINGYTSFNLKGFQAGLQDSLKNVKGTGTPSISIVSGSSNFSSNPDQRPTSVLLKASVTNPLYIYLAPATLYNPGMTIYDSATDPLMNSGWVRACSMKITNTVDFLQSPMHIFFSKSATYPTVVMANYTNPNPTNGSISFDTIRGTWYNPILNGTVNTYLVGNIGSTVILSGSQSDLVYYLLRNGSYYATTNGTGASISWASLPTGVYTVQAHRIATYMYSTMNGSVIIGGVLQAHNVTGGGSYCEFGSGQTVGLDGSETGVNYQLLQNGINYGTAIAGTGSALSWTGLPSGTYTIQAVQGTSNLMMIGSAIITMNANPATPTVSVINNCNGTSDLTASNYTGTLLWNTGASTSSINVSNAGMYSVTQTINGCISAAGIGTAAPKTTPATPDVSVQDNCGNSVLSTTATGNLLWNTGATTSSITVFSNGTLTVTQTVNGCTSIAGSGTATPKVIPATPIVNVVDDCGNSVLTITNAVSGATFTWSNLGMDNPQNVNSNATISVTQSLNGCTSLPGSATATPKSIPTAPIVNVVNNCNGTSTLTASAYTGTLLWSTGETTASITVTSAGAYTVTQTINGCASPAASGIAAPNQSVSAPIVNVVDNCDGSSILTASGYTGTLLWSTGATTSSITVFTSGIYSVTQTTNGCTSTSGSGIASPKTTPSAPSVSVVDNCDGSSVLTASNYTGTLLWNTGANTSSITVTTAGNYSVTQTINGCTSAAANGTASPKTTPATPIVSIQDNCGNSLLSTTATGNLLWSTGATTSSITVTSAGNYTVTQTVNGCISLAGSGTAAPKTLPTVPVITIEDHSNGTSTLTASSFTGTLLWSTGETTTLINVSVAGTYTVTQTVNGCTSLAASVNAAPPAATQPASQILICNDTLINSKNYQFDVYVRAKAINGTNSFNLKGFQAGFGQAYANIKGAGTLTTTVVSGSSQFGTSPDQRPTTVLLRPSATTPNYIQLNPTSLQSNGMTIDTNWVRACTIKLTNSVDFIQGTANIKYSSNGTYPNIVMANYANPYPVNGTIPSDTLRSAWTNPILNGTINAYTVSSLGSTVTLSGSQADLVYYLYKDGTLFNVKNGTGSSLTWLGATVGTYTVQAHRIATYMYTAMTGSANVDIMAYDVNGGGSYCEGSNGQTVGLSNSELNVDYQLLKNGVDYGSLVSGTGSALSWTGLTAGTYTVKAIHLSLNTLMIGNAVVNMVSSTAPTVNVVDNCDGTSTLTASNYTGSLLWNTTSVTSSINVTIAGTYTVTQNINGCISLSGSGIATPKTTPIAPIVTVVDNCNGTSVISAAIYSGNLLWNTSETTATITVTTAGTYSVTQTVNGCTSLAGSGIANPKSTPATPIVNVQDNCASSVLSTATTVGALLWNTGATTSSITVNNPGTYSVTLTVNGCTSAAGSAIAQPIAPVVQTISITPSANPATPGNSVTFTATVNVPVSGQVYKWYVNNIQNTLSSTSIFTYIPANGDVVKCTIMPYLCNSGATSNSVTMTTYLTKLKVTAMLQGFYNGIGMEPASDYDINNDVFFPKFSNPVIVDTISVVLRSTKYPTYDIIAEYHNLSLNTDGTISDIYVNLADTSIKYVYVIVNHRNSVETWSDSTYIKSSVTNYNFYTHPFSQEFGGNMYEVNGATSPNYLIWAGDVDQDGQVNIIDLSSIYDMILDPYAMPGYYQQDCNGEGMVNLLDLTIVYDNMNLGAGTINPFIFMLKKK